MTEEEFEVYCSTDKPFYCVKCLYEKNDPNILNPVLTNSSYDLLSNLPYNSSPNDSVNNAPSSFWLSDAYESETKYFDFDQINVLLNGMDNKEFSIIHVNAVSLVKRYDSVHAMLSRLAKVPSIIFVSEARLSNDKNLLKTQLLQIELDGYHKPVFKNSQYSAGGVVIYVSEELIFNERSDNTF